MTSTIPLSPEDRHLLARLAHSRRLDWWLVLLSGPLALGGGLLVLWIATTQLHGDDRALATAFGLGLLCFTGLCIWATWRRQQRQGAPLREVLARGSKHVTHGWLAAVQIGPGGSVAYQLADQALSITPILDQPGGKPPLLVDRLHSVEAVHDAEVELHWIALPAGQRLLLQAHYLPVQRASRQMQPSSAQDVARAVQSEKTLLGMTLGIGVMVWVVASFLGGFKPAVMVLMAAAILLSMAILGTPSALRLRRAQQSRECIQLQGPVTEALTARVKVGRYWSLVTWYRIGGVTWSPETGRTPVLGQRHTLHALSPASARHGYDVILSEPAEGPPETAAHEAARPSPKTAPG